MTSHPKCKTCDYFLPNEDKNDDFTDNLGTCGKIQLLWDASEWVKKDSDGWSIRSLSEGHEHDLAFVQDGSDYKAFLLPSEDFYCPMHSALKGD